ncbi:MAG: UDP-N-acetylmuramoyl-L-alanyl-D-glutamate--2,6-diaminopimelate ligase [Legionellales bacterium]|nr:UDP-N-acetylmuramoyl-L-alanyl-D-glutamate--2,6-diaminopimelate ligase [Legionellales bacterium]
MKLNELLQPWIKTAIPAEDVLGLQNDSRKLTKGDLFFAYPGEVTDGRSFFEQAEPAKAVGIVYDPLNPPKSMTLASQIPCFPIAGLARQLSAIAARFYAYPTRSIAVTGVTGTNGKTTIAYQLAQAYGLLGQRAAYVGTLGEGEVDHLRPLANTTPDALCLQKLCHDYHQAKIVQLCMEVSSHALHQGRVDDIDFKTAIYTNLSHDHLDYHHTLEAYAQAKALLFQRPTLRWAIINHDDAHSLQMGASLSSGCQKLTYGLHDGCDVRAVRWEQSMTGSQFEVVSPWGTQLVSVSLVGQFNIYNSLAVYSSLLAEGIDPCEVVRVMALLKASPGRMEVVSQQPCVIVDYAHTPDALENVLSTLTQLKKGRLGVVFGCGGDRDKTKRPVMGRIAGQYADFVIVTSDNPRSEDPSVIIDEICEGLLPKTKSQKIADRALAIQEGLKMTGPNDILLIAGKGHEAYQQIGQERFLFSDKDVVDKDRGLSKLQ